MRVRRWVTMHGLALNVCTDLRYFSLIYPCGNEDCPVTSMSRLCGREVTLPDVLPVFCSCFEVERGAESTIDGLPALTTARNLELIEGSIGRYNG